MEQFQNDIQICLLDNPSLHWHNEEVRSFFNEIVALKFNAYGAKYSNKVMPMSSDDFFATHLALTLDIDGKKEILLSYKSCDYAKYLEYQKSFPLIDFFNSISDVDSAQRIRQYLDNNWDKKIIYNSSLTINPILDSYLELKWFVLDLFKMSSLALLRHQNADRALMIGNRTLQTTKTFSKLGLKPLDQNSYFKMSEFDNTLGIVMEYDKEKYSCPYAEQKLVEYANYWKRKVDLSKSKSQIELPLDNQQYF